MSWKMGGVGMAPVAGVLVGWDAAAELHYRAGVSDGNGTAVDGLMVDAGYGHMGAGPALPWWW